LDVSIRCVRCLGWCRGWDLISVPLSKKKKNGFKYKIDIRE
jgi:hypothetical protein